MRTASLSDSVVVDFYREIINDGDSDMLPMLQLVERLAQKEYADSLPVSTSHYTLCVGPYCQGTDSATIAYLSHIEQFQIRYWDGNTHKAETHKVHAHDAENLFDSLAIRLTIRTQDDTTHDGSGHTI